MELVNMTPFIAHQSLTSDGRGREILLVVVKATWSLKGPRQLLEEQPPVIPADLYPGEPPATSISAPGDFALSKPATDVVLTGHAWPARAGDRQVDVTLRLGKLDKTVRVYGDRVWEKRGGGYSPSAARPFEKIPLVYERAFGGADLSRPDAPAFHPANPVGCGFAGPRSGHNFEGQPVPNLVALSRPVESPGADGVTACFAPVAPGWMPRRGFAGTCDEAWQRDVMPLLPRDFDPKFFNFAPADQQLESSLRPGDVLEVIHATPDHLLRFAIPAARPLVHVCAGDDLLEPPLACDTVLIDTDQLRLTLVWRGQVDLHQRVGELYWTSVEEGEPAHALA